MLKKAKCIDIISSVMKRIKENAWNLILIALLILLLFACSRQLFLAKQYGKTVEHFKFIFPFVSTSITNDTFFTIAIGRDVAKNGFSNVDKLTWHENLAFPHSGIFDLIIYGVYNITGNLDSIYVYTCIMTCALLSVLFFVSYKTNKSIMISIVYILIAWCLGSPTFYARAYQFSFIFYVLEFYFLQKLLEENKKRYAVIIVILGIFIANIHSSVYPIYFVMFLPHIVEIIACKFKIKIPKIEIEPKRGKKLFLITFAISLFTGLCSSAGFAPYTDMIKVMLGISNNFIGEIAPTTLENNKIFYPIILVTLLFMINGKQKIKLTDILYILGFGLLTILVYRGFFFFLFLSGISITRIIATYFRENELKINKFLRNIVFGCSFALFILLILADSFRIMDYEQVSEKFYPIHLADYILENENINEMKLYNDFNYGSYLEYRGIKTFIDSRSGMFCDEFNPGCTILADWYSIFNEEKEHTEIFEKYGFTDAITTKFSTLSKELEEDESWERVYEDKYWELYKRK